MLDPLESRRLFATLVAGQTAVTATSSPTQLKNYSVSLTAGQFVAIAAGDRGTGSFTPKIQLIGPNHKTVRTAIGDTGAFLGTVAPTTGTYIVRLTDETRTHTGSVNVTAFYTGSSKVTDGDDAVSTTNYSGRRFGATLSPGDLDVWAIKATKGQFLSVDAAENVAGADLGVGIALINPDGTGLTSSESSTSVKIDVNSASSGYYYAVAYVPAQNATGRYGISFGQTPGTQYAGDPDVTAPLVSGQTRTGDLPAGDIDIYQASLTKGQTVSLTVSRDDSTVEPEILLVDSAGKVVSSSHGTKTASLSYTLLTGGTYSILLRNYEGDANGAYTFEYSLS